MTEQEPQQLDIPDHEALSFSEDENSTSLRQAVIEKLLADGVISKRDLTIYQRVQRAIERPYRQALKRIGYESVRAKMNELRFWEELCEQSRQKFGDSAVVNIFTDQDGVERCLRIYEAVRESVPRSEEGRLVETIRDLATISARRFKAVSWQRRPLVEEAMVRAKEIMMQQEEMVF